MQGRIKLGRGKTLTLLKNIGGWKIRVGELLSGGSPSGAPPWIHSDRHLRKGNASRIQNKGLIDNCGGSDLRSGWWHDLD